MYAVIKTGGKQYRVSEGDKLRVEKLPGDVGSEITLSEVLFVGGDKVAVGKPLVTGAKVTAKITAQDKDKKIIVFKFRRRKNYRRKNGHRQPYTELQINADPLMIDSPDRDTLVVLPTERLATTSVAFTYTVRGEGGSYVGGFSARPRPLKTLRAIRRHSPPRSGIAFLFSCVGW